MLQLRIYDSFISFGFRVSYNLLQSLGQISHNLLQRLSAVSYNLLQRLNQVSSNLLHILKNLYCLVAIAFHFYYKLDDLVPLQSISDRYIVIFLFQYYFEYKRGALK